jgi:RNA polymerase sigma-70 factor (ECF subfamily)
MTRGWAVGQRREPASSPANGEARLIARVADGDLRAFEELYRSYHQRLTRFIVNMIHRPQIAEEVLNDTMLVVWRRAGAYDGASKVSTWIFAIAYRRALSAMRGRREPIEDQDAGRRECPEDGPERLVGRGIVHRRLVEAMGELSADHRAVVDLTYFHEMDYREIAEIMGCPLDTVKTRMYHARRHLRRVLSGELIDWL